jgi:HPt (histidine-containing phosphotransfer) domain-containing protein
MLTKQDTGFSIETLLAAIDGDMELAIEVLESFIEQTPAQLSQIEQALASEDMVTVGKLLHTQKPSVQLLGLDEAYQQLRTAESLLAARTPSSEITPLVRQYITNLEAGLSAMNSFLQARLKNPLVE